MNPFICRMRLASALSILFLATAAWALEPETIAAIASAVQIGTAVSQGAIDPQVAADIIRSLHKDGVKNDVIRDLFKSMVDSPAVRAARNDSGMMPHGNGMGAFVQDAHARGLRGRALAEAIHQEQARRGIPGQVRKVEADEIESDSEHDSDIDNEHHGSGRGHEKFEKPDEDEKENGRGRSDETDRGPQERHHHSKGGRR